MFPIFLSESTSHTPTPLCIPSLCEVQLTSTLIFYEQNFTHEVNTLPFTALVLQKTRSKLCRTHKILFVVSKEYLFNIRRRGPSPVRVPSRQEK